MSKPRYTWWAYMKDIIRKYPERIGKQLSGVSLREYEAVSKAVEDTLRLPDGKERIRIIDLVLWKGTHQISGAALQIPCSERTAQRWHAGFIKTVAKNFKCDGLI